MPPRTILPKDEQGSSESLTSLGPPKTTKRKAVSSACIPCRKRKSKCDGGQPSCSTCLAVYRTDCSYDQDTDHRRKGALRKDIQSLQVKNTALDVIVNSLCALPENEATALFQSLRRGERLDLLAEAINAGNTDSLRALDTDLSEHTGTPGSSFHTQTASVRSADSSRSPSDRKWSDATMQNTATENSGSWFRVPQDAEFVEHLLNLYFSWHHPFYALFSKDHFLRDMSRGSTKYCSAMLVNAVLAMACQYSDRSVARTGYMQAGNAGDYFFGEAERYANSVDEASLTAVQALAVMALREASEGRDHISYRLAGRCVRLAMEMGLHLSDTSTETGLRATEIEIRKLTFWGVFNLEMICCLSLGRVSSIPKNAVEVDKPANSEKLDGIFWQPYEDVNLPVSPSATHPMKCLLFIKHQSKLSELINDINLNLYAPKERFTPRRLAAAYNQYQSWYSDLPEIFHLQNTAMPHVINLHMYYHMCVLHLFRPFMKLDLSSIGLYPHELCTYCATEITKLTGALRGMYGLRRTPLATSAIVLSASTIHLLNLPSQGAAMQLTQSMHDLQTMSVNHRFAFYCIEVINRLANQWGIILPEGSLNLTPYRSPEPHGAAPNMSLFFTQATLSNESIDALVAPTTSLRHDSGGIFEPSFVPHNFPILPSTNHPPTSASASLHHSMQSTPVHTTPIPGSSVMWTSFPTQQMATPELQEYQMMDNTASYGYQGYPPA